MTFYNVSEIAKHFRKGTGKSVEFIRTKNELILKIEDTYYRYPRRSGCECNEYSKDEVIQIFTKILTEKGILNAQ